MYLYLRCVVHVENDSRLLGGRDLSDGRQKKQDNDFSTSKKVENEIKLYYSIFGS